MRRVISCAFILWIAPTIFGQVAVSSTFAIGVFADANQNDSDLHSDYILQNQYGTLNPYNGNLSVSDEDLLNPGRKVRVTAQASASWTDAGQGSVTWRNMGWVQNTIASSGTKLNDFVVNGPTWGYTFTATSDGIFTLDYDVRGTGNTFGLLGVDIGWSGPEGGLNLFDPYDPTVSGNFSRVIVNGQTYTVELRNHGNHFTAPLEHVYTSMMDADFAWKIQPVPEPLSMVSVGIGVIALLRRRKKP